MSKTSNKMFHKMLLFTLVLLGHASAHMKMAKPVPYGQSTLDTSPLKPVKIGGPGSDYPCKQREGVYNVTQQNIIPVGVPQELSFDGSASHGGGSCQLAISLDKEPTASSVFKLIQTFEGGCPTSGAGNDGSEPFTFVVPKGFPSGDFALAWTWYNKIGNREIYQNCAPITVTGGADNNDLFDSLPNHYIINLPASECSTVETSDQIIPYPGQYVVKAQAGSLSSATGPSCAASAAAMTEGVKGYKSAAGNDGGGYGAPAGSSAATTPASSAAQPSSAPSYNNGQYSAPAATSAAASSPASAPTYAAAPSSAPAPTYAAASSSAPTPLSAAAPSSATAPTYGAASSFTTVTSSSATPDAPAAYPTLSVASDAGVSGPASGTVSSYTPAGTGSTSSGSTSASGNGIICDDAHSDQFGVDVAGKTVWRQVAAGTTCQEVAAYRFKRSMRSAHVRRHIQNGRHF